MRKTVFSRLRNPFLAAVLLPLLAFGMVACNTPSWVNTAIQLLPVLSQAALAGVQIYATVAGNVDPSTLSAIDKGFAEAAKDFALAQTLIQQYEKNPKSSGSLLAQIDAALQDAQANLTGILTAAHVFNPALQAKVSAAVGLIVSQVAALLQVIPQITSQKVSATAPTQLLSPSAFKNAFTAVSGVVIH